ncbi:MAG TPA: hypothetical protein VHT30_01390 [Acidimicrobiales bacterium]|nr:hypothetical protein [Acidimicrobiales bacterium]
MPPPVEHNWGRGFLWAALVFSVAGVVTSGGQQLHLGTWFFAVPLGRALLWTAAVIWLLLGAALRFGHRGLFLISAVGFLTLIPLYFSAQPSKWLDPGYQTRCPTFASHINSTDEACFDLRQRRDTMLTILAVPTIVAFAAGVTLGAVGERRRLLHEAGNPTVH